MSVASPNAVQVAALGSSPFCALLHGTPRIQSGEARLWCGTLEDAWSIILARRPHIIVLEVGISSSEQTQRQLRELVEQLRERFDRSVYVVLALTAPERLLYSGDLLFSREEGLDGSQLIDDFIVAPPPLLSAAPSLPAQLEHVLELCPLPYQQHSPFLPLNAPGWAHSYASPTSRELWLRWLPRYARYTAESPLVLGPTGTGKTNLAFALHRLSGRKGNFVSITPRDFSSSELVQAELFGAVAGAYTGAVDRWGLVNKAEHGTLFIDELQSIDKDLQGKLITFIENKLYRRVGSSESVNADVRFVFATNRSLPDMLSADVLREDFAYRLERVLLELPPLRARPLDIVSALAFGLAKVHRQRPSLRPVLGVTPSALRLLFSHPWPGNLRQLENYVAKLCEYADIAMSGVITEEMVYQLFTSTHVELHLSEGHVVLDAARRALNDLGASPPESLDALMRRMSGAVRETILAQTGGDAERAATLLGEHARSLELFAKARNVRSAARRG